MSFFRKQKPLRRYINKKNTIVKKKSAKPALQKKQQEPVDYKTIDVVPYKAVTSSGAFILKNDMVQDIYLIRSLDLSSLNKDEQNHLISGFGRLNKLYLNSYKIVSLKFPVNTQEQQRYWEKRRLKTKDFKQKRSIREQIEKLKLIEKSRSNQEYFLFLTAKNESELQNAFKELQQYSVGILDLTTVDFKKKLRLLYKLNNMNTNYF